MELKCKKSLYKSTYRKNAFKAGKRYTESEEYKNDPDHRWIIDETGRLFSFSKANWPGFYYFEA